MATSVVTAFVGLSPSSAEQFVTVGGTKAGDQIIQIIELSPNPGTIHSLGFGAACPVNGQLVQLPTGVDFSTTTLLASLLR